ncbi:hypothetical protein SmJEL517_g06045 [Synchytrium microbalum]|uniref:START domain-containing protein n=1 Tax=Synchytrium microbalum TaxID=1806994 RepID=A0A507BYP7_9FUNG|nr:uncharacterized protein SmJEL517_g06045 [Synchytrium microbalum]TPX30393.1 hypothetical protein SmJEL517_g06045 [Synchytrium microbalum]
MADNPIGVSVLLERGRELHRLLLNARDWSKVDIRDTSLNIQLYRRNAPNQQVAVRVSTTVEAHAASLGSVVSSLKGRDFWDTLFDEHELISRIDPETSIVRYGMRPVRGSSPRDFALLMHSSTARSTHLCVAVSIPMGHHATRPSHVRGHIDLLTWLIEPDYDDTKPSTLLSTAPRLRVSCTLLMDPKHSLFSSSYLQFLYAELPKSVALVCEYLNRRGFPPHLSHWGSRVKIDTEQWNEAGEFEVVWSSNSANSSNRTRRPEDGEEAGTDDDDDSGVGYEDGSRELEVRLDARRWTGLELTLKAGDRLLDPELVDVREDNEDGIIIRAGCGDASATCVLKCRRGICNLGTVMVNNDLRDLSPEILLPLSPTTDTPPESSTWEEDIREALDSPMVGQFLSYPAQWERGMDVDTRKRRPRAMSANHIQERGRTWFPRFRKSPGKGSHSSSSKEVSADGEEGQDAVTDLPAGASLSRSGSLKSKVTPRRFSLSSVLWRPNNTNSVPTPASEIIESAPSADLETGPETPTVNNEPDTPIFAVPRETARFYSIVEVLMMALAALIIGIIFRIGWRLFVLASLVFLAPLRWLPHQDIDQAAMAQLVAGVDGGMLMGGLLPVG